MNTPSTGICPRCEHVNDREWVLCDKCGARLPWAPPEGPKRKLGDLSNEQLAMLTKASEKKEPPFLLTLEGRPALGAIVAVALALFWLYGLWR